jgi:hypothetical protein
MSGKYEKVYWEFGTNAKVSSVSVWTAEITEANFAAQETLRAAFEAAVDAVSLGNNGAETKVAVYTPVVRNPSLNPVAQRENKWLVTLSETGSGNPFTFTIPCYDPSLLAADGESMDTAATEYADLVTATEAYARSNDGNLGTVVSIKFRARNI